MKKAMTTLLLSTALASSLVACSQSDDCENKSTATGSQKIMTDSQQMTAAGEHLMDRDHWMQADALFAKALVQNPQDLKAQFYRAVLKPYLVTKGLATRVKPFLRQHGDIAGYEAQLAKIPDSASKAFLLDGKEDISSLEDVQLVLTEQRQAFSELRQFLKAHEDMELTLNSPELQRKMNSADLIVLRQAVAGVIISYNLATNYTAAGAEKISKQLANSRLSVEQKQKLIASVPTIGKLRQDQGFNEILSMGADLSSAAKWAIQYQDRLCAGGPEVKNRPGYVLEYGVCLENKDQVQRDFALLDEALKGPFETVLKTSGEEKTATLDIRSFLSKPVEDLRSIAPAAYSACGQVTGMADKSVGGLFPHADAEEFLPGVACAH